MFDLFHYGFLLRGLEAGLIIALISPLIGIFLVLRRYSLIADTLSHVSFAGLSLGFLLGVNPILTAIGVSVLSSVAIEKLRVSQKIYGESALSLFLSGSLAVAVVLMSARHGFGVNLANFLFGSIVTVQPIDVVILLVIGCLVALIIAALYKELVYISFDEEAAQVSGIPTRPINLLLISLAALVISLAIPIVGVLLVSALIVIPVLAALQFRASFKKTLLLAELFSVVCVVVGIITAYYFNLSTGGTIVIVSLLFFLVSLLLNRR